MWIMKQRLKNWVFPAVGLLYAIGMTTAVLSTGSDSLVRVHTILTGILSLVAAGILMRPAMKYHNLGTGFYTSLGMCCLAMGNLYFLLLAVVSYTPDEISVGLFAKSCCYLFFIAELTGLNTDVERRGFAVLAIALTSTVATAVCALAVIMNNAVLISLAAILLNVLCLVLAVKLLVKKRHRLYALTITIMTVKSMLSVFTALSFATDSLSPLLYALMIHSVSSLREGDQNAA